MQAAWILSGAALLTPIASCAQLYGFEHGLLADSTEDAGANGLDAGTEPLPPDAATSLPPVVLAVPIPADCTSRQPEREALFVDQAASASNEECSYAAPCTSIQRALSRVSASQHVIHVGRGLYAEALRIPAALLRDGLRIEGRWEHRGADWLPDCEPSSELAIVGESAPALDVGDDDGDAGLAGSYPLELSYLALLGRAAPELGASSYGLFVRRAQVILIGSQLVADPGAPGFSATEADRPLEATESAACNGVDSVGAPGRAGSALGPGAFTEAGYLATRAPNRAAAAGGRGPCTACETTAEGGAPGRDATGGGASVAAYLVSAQLELRGGSTLVARGGGAGGHGGPGGLGGTGLCSTGPAQPAGTGGTGSPATGGPTACVVQLGALGSSLGASQETCTLPAYGARGGAGGDGVQAAAGVLGVVQ